MLTRRKFLALGRASALMLVLPGCRAGALPLPAYGFGEEDYRRLPVLGLATSLTEEHDYAAVVEGQIPSGLEGTLYRNGPGLFERAGYRKRCLLDGDGMVQAFRIQDGKVHFRNRFVRTEKFEKESAAGRYLFPTWSTQAPGGMLANLGGGTLPNQAGVSVVVRDGRLYAFDEFHPPYELDPETLETLGESSLGQPAGKSFFCAHSKRDLHNGDWIFFSLEFGIRPRLHLTVLGADGALRKHQVHRLAKNVYMHDFFVSDRHILIHLHPVEIAAFPLLAGMSSITGALRWRPQQGSEVLIFEREGAEKPRRLEAESSWMWHSLNAFESEGEIIADFVGYRNPDHFLGEDPALFAIMEGRRGDYQYPGELRRFVINLRDDTLRQESLGSGNYDFPIVNPLHGCHRHRFGYFVGISPGNFFFDEIARVDTLTGRSESFRFGPGQFCTEPIFAPLPGHTYDPAGEEPGWLLSEVYDGNSRRSFLAILRADNIAAGPVARAWLEHHVPLGFHGFWQPTPA
jgi:all-trans-8'-apo-beta-carotenal 15,15'-oxygenase